MEKKMMAFVALVIGAVALNTRPTIGGPPCYIELTDLLPCATFVMMDLPPQKPGDMCCLGMQKVVKNADTTQKRRDLCTCLKAHASLAGVKASGERVKNATDGCNVKLNVPVDPNLDCNTIP